MNWDVVKKEIEECAYDHYEFRQEYNIPGDALSDWLLAEKEIMNYYNPNRLEHAQMFRRMVDMVKYSL